MSDEVKTFELTGDAVFGIAPRLLPKAALAALAVEEPVRVRLGRLPPDPAAMAARPRLAAFFDGPRAAYLPPASVDYAAKAKASVGRMYLNDRLGDCVIAGKAHALGVWTGNDADSGGEVQATDAEVQQQYQRWCGAGDNGCVITRVLDAVKAEGFTAGGKRYKIDGYAAVDWTDATLVKAAVHAFGAVTLGINLPAAWTSSAVWDVTNTRVVGGHDVTAVGYDEQGVVVVSWGRLYRITWAAFTSRKWLEEAWALLAPAWYNADGLAPSGWNVPGLKGALAAVGGGRLPDGPTPTPTPTPTPVDPPAPVPGDRWVIEVPAAMAGRKLKGVTLEFDKP